nr:TIGR02680 family protein [Tumebacillus amylolyticus]
MHRAGMLNFWYYDEQEFEIEGGRVLFRGSNGAGKSVTMQSLLPLVLDGDTRPSRLDPFGSRDRKIEYYLLGDQGQHAERTGYLWLEFAHGTSGRYLTIGIGLRARRGNRELDFWGFAITDNRRIGRGFDLYKREFSMGQENKVPHTWKEMRDLIGEGGHFVRERKEYAMLVNKLLFRYENQDSYGEMLHLLLQLRSPKLSKDFKPTTIYGILKSALPSLEEDELYPLAEVLESIDQIGDRQRELEHHVGYVEDLEKAYGTYNRYQLFHRAEKAVQSAARLQEKDLLVAQQQQELQSKEQELAEQRTFDQKQAHELRNEQAELDVLNQDEAFSKRQDLQSKYKEKQTLELNLDKSRRDLDYWRIEEKKVRLQIETASLQMQAEQAKQADLLSELEASAREMEFVYHDVFHRRVSREMEQSVFWASWKMAIHEHQASLNEALKCAREHSQSKKDVFERDAQLSAARERRDEMEKQFHAFQVALEKEKEQQQERMFAWRDQLQELQVSETEMISLLQQLALFPERTYEEVKRVLGAIYDPQVQEVRIEALQNAAFLKQLRDAEQEKRVELQSWRHQREPEPVRSKHRERTRQIYGEQQVVGMPLYEACEFFPHVPEETRAMLESLLQETGLLDSWVGKLGVLWKREDQEFWVQTQPLMFGHTLADFLRPTPPEDGSVSAEWIQDVLQSIEIGDPVNGSERVVLSEQGFFRLGSLLGKVQPKERAEYIGKESRKQTRLATIKRLEAELADLTLQVEAHEGVVEALQAREMQLQKEYGLFPDAKELFEARDAVLKGQVKLEAAQGDVEVKNDHHKRAMEKEREVRGRLLELTQTWSFLKNEARLTEAMEQLSGYRGFYGELQTACTRYLTAQKQVSDGAQQVDVVVEKLEIEEAHQQKHLEVLEEIQATIQAYEKSLQEMKAEEKYQRLQELMRSVELRRETRKNLGNRMKQVEIAIGILQNELRNLHRERMNILSELEDLVDEWRTEWKMRLVAPWREQELPSEMQDQVALCRTLAQTLGKEFEPKRAIENAVNNIYKVFNEVNVHLHQYVLEWEDLNGRQLVKFSYDRGKPLTPERLLDQLRVQLAEQNLLLQEKEKELLEKVLIQSVGVSIRQKIQRAEAWVREMNLLMSKRNTSSGLQLKLRWEPKEKGSEMEMETVRLVELLRRDYEHLTNADREELYQHFQEKIQQAKAEADHVGALREIIHQFLDYREWYRFQLLSKQGEQVEYRELTDPRFNVMSGGEKAMTMYIPLFVAVSSRYKGTAPDAPKLISLDEAFAGVDEENVRDLFELLTEMEFDYMMTSQVLWGCFDTVPKLSIYEIMRPKGAESVDVIPYTWDGKVRRTNFEAIEQVG